MDFKVPASAVHVLRNLRYSSLQRCLWIDAICIDQGDTVERSSQVMLMSSIYASAQRTLIWLGYADEHTAAAVRCLHKITQLGSLDIDEATSREDAVLADSAYAVSTVFERPWFRRLWVYQEVILSTVCECVIGEHTFAWKQLEDIAHYPESSKKLRTLQGVLSKPARVGTYMPYWTKTHRQEWSRWRTPLHEIINSTRSLECSDPRDTIYALLGLTSWVRLKREIPDRLRPNYDASLQDCMRDATVAMIEEYASLEPLSYRISEKQQPTWAVSWYNMISLASYDVHRLPPFWGIRKSIEYDACKARPVATRVLANSTRPDSIFLYGYPSVTVAATSPNLSVYLAGEHEGDPQWRANLREVITCASDLMGISVVDMSVESARRILTTLAARAPSDEDWRPDTIDATELLALLGWSMKKSRLSR